MTLRLPLWVFDHAYLTSRIIALRGPRWGAWVVFFFDGLTLWLLLILQTPSPTFRPFNIQQIPLRWNSKNSQGENRAEIHDTESDLGGCWLENLPWNWIQLGFGYFTLIHPSTLILSMPASTQF